MFFNKNKKGDNGDRKDKFRLIIAGGGTGGHIFPGISIAREVKERFDKSEVLYITGHKELEADILKDSGFKSVSIKVEGLKGRGWKHGAAAMIKTVLGIFQAAKVIRKFSPDIVLGVGGYSSGPACVAARFMGVPTAVHEQNSFPGLTNRLLCRIVNKVFISFEESRKYFSGGLIILTGNPVRKEFLKAEGKRGRSNGDFTILVVGGSQGARAINRAFVEALGILREKGRYPRVIHQTGVTDLDDVMAQYRSKDLKGEVTAFIKDIARAYHKSDIVVSRAGATTVSELAAAGKPSIIIPYPFSANGHQETNAGVLANNGGAEMLLQDNLTGESLAALLMKYMDDREALARMGEMAARIGKPNAAEIIVDEMSRMVRGA